MKSLVCHIMIRNLNITLPTHEGDTKAMDMGHLTYKRE